MMMFGFYESIGSDLDEDLDLEELGNPHDRADSRTGRLAGDQIGNGHRVELDLFGNVLDRRAGVVAHRQFLDDDVLECFFGDFNEFSVLLVLAEGYNSHDVCLQGKDVFDPSL